MSKSSVAFVVFAGRRRPTCPVALADFMTALADLRKREHGQLAARADLSAAVAAMRAWDVEEYQRLREWWREHGGIIMLADQAGELLPDGQLPDSQA